MTAVWGRIKRPIVEGLISLVSFKQGEITVLEAVLNVIERLALPD